jgi:hypothetical protein
LRIGILKTVAAVVAANWAVILSNPVEKYAAVVGAVPPPVAVIVGAAAILTSLTNSGGKTNIPTPAVMAVAEVNATLNVVPVAAATEEEYV